jgi:hypothetical protein
MSISNIDTGRVILGLTAHLAIFGPHGGFIETT